MGLFDIFKSKKEEEEGFPETITIKSGDKFGSMENYTGYVVAIKEDKNQRQWFRVYMGKTKKKKEKEFWCDLGGIRNINFVTGNNPIGGKFKVFLQSVNPANDKKEIKVIMGWKFAK